MLKVNREGYSLFSIVQDWGGSKWLDRSFIRNKKLASCRASSCSFYINLSPLVHCQRQDSELSRLLSDLALITCCCSVYLFMLQENMKFSEDRVGRNDYSLGQLCTVTGITWQDGLDRSTFIWTWPRTLSCFQNKESSLHLHVPENSSKIVSLKSS